MPPQREQKQTLPLAFQFLPSLQNQQNMFIFHRGEFTFGDSSVLT